MNLYQVITAIEQTAAMQPPIGTIVRNDIFRLNASPIVRYSTFAWLQGEHRDADDMMEWNFTLFYVDRLTERRDNEVQIQSTGIECLQNVLLGLEALGIFAEEHSFQTFNQRFADECAGVFCRVVLRAAKNDLCEVTWEGFKGDFSPLDYNEDFHCWEQRINDRTIYYI